MKRPAIAFLLMCLQGMGLPVLADIKFLTHSLENAVTVDDAGAMRGKPEGGRRAFYVETVRAIMRERGISLPIQEAPLSRAFSLLERGQDYALFNVVRNPSRENKYKWVGPISDLKTYFFEHRDHPTGIHTVDDARHVSSICAVHGNNMIGWFKRHDFKNIITANSYEACIQMLEYGRADLMYGTEHQRLPISADRAAKIRQTGVATQDPTAPFENTDLGYIAFSKNVPDEEIALWQAALDAVKASGEYDRLKASYLVPREQGTAR